MLSAGGERAGSLGVGALGARGARSCPLRDDRLSIGATAAGPCPLRASRSLSRRRPGRETLPVVADSSPAAVLGEVDVVLPILPGPFGEDGTVQGLLELAGSPTWGRASPRRLSAWTRICSSAVTARPRPRGRPQRHAPARRRDLEPVRLPRLRQPARLGSSVASRSALRGGLVRAVARRGDTTRSAGGGAAHRHRGGGGVLGNLRPAPLARPSARSSRTRVVRLRGQVRRGRLRHHRARTDPRRRGGAWQQLASRVRGDGVRGDGARGLLRRPTERWS